MFRLTVFHLIHECGAPNKTQKDKAQKIFDQAFFGFVTFNPCFSFDSNFSTMADNENDELVDYDEEEVRNVMPKTGSASFLGRCWSFCVCDSTVRLSMFRVHFFDTFRVIPNCAHCTDTSTFPRQQEVADVSADAAAAGDGKDTKK